MSALPLTNRKKKERYPLAIPVDPLSHFKGSLTGSAYMQTVRTTSRKIRFDALFQRSETPLTGCDNDGSLVVEITNAIVVGNRVCTEGRKSGTTVGGGIGGIGEVCRAVGNDSMKTIAFEGD